MRMSVDVSFDPLQCRIVVTDEYGHWPADQIGRADIIRIAIFNRDVLALDEGGASESRVPLFVLSKARNRSLVERSEANGTE